MKRLLALLLLAISIEAVYPQETDLQKAQRYLQERNEVYLRFTLNDRNDISLLTRVISIDQVRGMEVHAYANKKEFEHFLRLGYKYEVLTPPSMQYPKEEYVQHNPPLKSTSGTIWNFYPSYEQYVAYMDSFALLHPDICRLIHIGTTVQGRELLAVEISDSVNVKEGEPEVFLTSSIHGDETTGYILMMHLIDSLLTGYGNVPRITSLVDNCEIFINPLANPDGTYHGGNGTVWGSIRENANGVDLNRNYPDPQDGQHPDGYPWQPETVAFMAFADSNDISLSMNFHGGSEVFNYPWDTWNHIPADDSWWEFVGREYADTCHKYGPPGYLTDEDNGVVRGYLWYEINGGRQDYMNYFRNAREVTLEISAIKTMYVSQLLNYWKYNRRSFLDYIEEATYGIDGQVTDSITGEPLHAKVFIFSHDVDNSFVYSKLPSGWYFRYLDEGSWDLTFSASGYHTKTINGINVTRHETTRADVQLVPLTYGIQDISDSKEALQVYPNPATGIIRIILPASLQGKVRICVFDMAGRYVYNSDLMVSGQSVPEVDLSSLKNGIYHISAASEEKILNGKVILGK